MVEQDQTPEYVVVVTDLKLNHWWNLRKFITLVNRVSEQMDATPGVISRRLKANYLKLRFSTLSVWESEGALAAFIPTGAHRAAVASTPEISRTGLASLRWRTDDPDAVTWEEAFARLSATSIASGRDNRQVRRR